MTTSRICTADNPAPRPYDGSGYSDKRQRYEHPDASIVTVTNDHGDEKYRCPYCGYIWWIEGADS